MSVVRSSVAVNLDVKKNLDAAQTAYERQLNIPKGSLSQQVFLECSSQLSLVLLQLLEAAGKFPREQPNSEEIRKQASDTVARIRTETMFRQLAINQREAQDAAENLQKTLVAAGIIALVIGLAAGAAGAAIAAGRARK